MKILFLGTDASEGYPALFCDCENCRNARKKKDKNIRSRASIIINNDFMVDFPPETLLKVQLVGLSLSHINILAFTHSHIDHFAYYELSYRKEPFTLNKLDELKILGNKVVIRQIKDFFKDKVNELKLDLIEVLPFEKYELKNYIVYPIRVVHLTNFNDENPLNYIIIHGNKTLLYACDTGTYTEKHT